MAVVSFPARVSQPPSPGRVSVQIAERVWLVLAEDGLIDVVLTQFGPDQETVAEGLTSAEAKLAAETLRQFAAQLDQIAPS